MKKKAKSKPREASKPTLLDRLPKNQGERLELMIRLTERAITNPEYEKGLVEQAKRLKEELAQWKKAK